MILSPVVLLLGLFGGGNDNPRNWVEVVQEPQVEDVQAPAVGRQAEPYPQPFTPVRYLTPEQRAEPIIVEPAPVVTYAEPVSQNRNVARPQSAQETPGNPSLYGIPDYITSSPNYAIPSPETVSNGITDGSATGSTAIAQY